MTVSEKSESWGAEVGAALKAAGVRAELDVGSDKIGAKIRLAHAMKPVYQVVIGEKEQDERTITVKGRGNVDLGSMTLEAFVAQCVEESKVPF